MQRLPNMKELGFYQLPKLPTAFKKQYVPKQKEDLLSDYNDPYALNSMADVISASFNPKMDNANWFNDKGILNALNIIPNTVKMINDTTIKPIAAGQFGKAAINNLFAFTEVLDIFANPVKGLLMEGGEGFDKATGLTDAGRVNYDWNTGNLALDITYEVLSDPLNWVSMFIKPAVTGTLKTSLKKSLIGVGAEASEELDKLVKLSVKSYLNGDTDTMTKSLAQSLGRLKLPADDTLISGFTKAMKQLEAQAVDYTNLEIINGVSKLVRTADKVESAVFYAGLKSTPVLGLPWVAYKGGSNIYHYANRQLIKKLEPVLTPSQKINILKYEEFNEIYETHKSSFNPIFEKITGKGGIDDDKKFMMIQGAILSDINTLYNSSSIKLIENVPDAIPEEVYNNTVTWIQNYFNGDAEMFYSALKDFNKASNNQYLWFEKWFKAKFDIKESFIRVYKYPQDIASFIKNNIYTQPEMDAMARMLSVDAYIKAEYSTGIEDMLKQISDINAKHDGIFIQVEEQLNKIISEYNGQMDLVSKGARETDETIEASIKLSYIKDYEDTSKDILTKVNTTKEVGLSIKNMDDTLDKMIYGTDDATIINWDIVYDSEDVFKTIGKRGLMDILEDVGEVFTPSHVYELSSKLTDRSLIPNNLDHLIGLIDEAFFLSTGHSGLTASTNHIRALRKELIESVTKIQAIVDYKEEYIKLFSESLQSISDITLGFKDNPMFDSEFVIGFINNILTKIDISEMTDASFVKAMNNIDSRLNSIQKFLDNIKKPIEEVLPSSSSETLSQQINRQTAAAFEDNYNKLSKHFVNIKDQGKDLNGIDIPFLSKVNDSLKSDIMQFFQSGIDDTLNSGTVMNVIQDWFDLNGKPLAISPHGFIEKIDNLLKIPSTEVVLFDDAVQGLSDTVHFLDMSLKSTANQSSDVGFSNILLGLREVLDNYEINQLPNNQAMIRTDVLQKFYKFKLEQMNMTDKLILENPVFYNTFKELTDSSNLEYQVLHNLAMSGNYSAIMAIESVLRFGNYKAFREDIAIANIRQEVKDTFLTTILSPTHMQWNAHNVVDNLEHYAAVLFKKSEEHYNSIIMNKRLTIDSLFQESLVNKDFYEKFVKELNESGVSNVAHTVDYDNIRLKHIAESMLDLDDTSIKIYVDTETNSNIVNIAEISQIGAYVGPNDKFTINTKVSDTPSAQTMRGVLKDNTSTKGELTNLWESIYQTYATSIDKGLLQFLDYVSEHMTLDNKVQILMHNSSKFDKPVILNNLKRILYEAIDNGNEAALKQAELLYSKAMDILNNIEIIDTLELLSKKQGYLKLTSEERGQLLHIIKTQAERQTQFRYNLRGSEPFEPYFIQPMNSSIAYGLKELGTILTKDLETGVVDLAALGFSNLNISLDDMAALANDLFNRGSEIESIYKDSIKAVNKHLNGQYISASIFDEPDFLAKYTDMFNNPNEYAQFVSDVNDYMNAPKNPHHLSQALYANKDEVTGEFKYIEGTRLYGTKLGADTELIQEYFNIPVDYPISEVSRYTKYSQIISNRVKYIKNSTVLKHEAENINNFLRYVLNTITQPTLGKVPFVPEYLKRIVVHDSYIQNFSMLQFMHGRPESIMSNFWKEIRDNPPEEFKKVIEYIFNPTEVIYSNTMTDDIVSYMASKKTANVLRIAEKSDNLINKINVDVDVIQNSMRTIFDSESYLKNFGNGLDANSAQRASVQRLIASVNDTVKAAEYFNDMVKMEFGPPTLEHIERASKRMNNLKTTTQRIAALQTFQFAQMSDEEIFKYLATIGKGMVTIGVDDNRTVVRLLDRANDLKKIGINVVLEEHMMPEDIIHSGQLYVTLDKSIKLDFINKKTYFKGIEINPPVLKDYSISELINGLDLDTEELIFYQEHLAKSREQLINLTNGKAAGSLGDTTNEAFYTKLYYDIPLSIRKTMPDISEILKSQDGLSFNHSVLGSMQNRRAVAEFLPNDILSIQVNAVDWASKINSTYDGYAQLYYNDLYKINTGIFKDISDAELFEALKDAPEFKLAYLTDDGKRLVPKSFPIHSIEEMSEARRLGAVIIPEQTFNKSFEVLQNFNMSETELKWWHRLMFMYKSGFLANSGLVMRNIVDSTVKNMISTEDPIGIMKTYPEGFRVYGQYKKSIDHLLKIKGGITADNIDLYFKEMNTSSMSKELFEIVHSYMTDGPAGTVQALQEFYRKQAIDSGKLARLNSFDKLWDNYSHAASKLLSVNNEVEQIARLSEFLWATRNGFNTSEAYRLVTKTHFDYGLKTKKDMLIELIFPFYTFKMRNFEYWIDAVQANPFLLSLFRDVMTPIWNFDEQDEYEMENNRSLQYQILSGNLPLNDAGATLKLNPSFMDVYNTITDPIGTVSGALAPPFKFLMNMASQGIDEDNFLSDIISKGDAPSFLGSGGYDDSFISMIPYAGAFYQRHQNALKYAERTGNKLFEIPGLGGELGSIFGATQRWDLSQNKTFRGYNTRSYSTKNKLSFVKTQSKASKNYYPKTFHNSKVYSRNFYHKRWYNHFNSVYGNFYNSTGASKLKMMYEPTTPRNVIYKIKLFQHYF